MLTPRRPAALSVILALSLLALAPPAGAQSARELKQAYRDLVKATAGALRGEFLDAARIVLKDRASRSLPAVAEAFGKLVDRDADMDPGTYFAFHSEVARLLGERITEKDLREARKQLEKLKHPRGRLILLEAANFSPAWSIEEAARTALDDRDPLPVRRALDYLRNQENLETLELILDRYVEVDGKGSAYRGADWDRGRLAFQDALTRMLKIRLGAALDYKSYLSLRKNRPDLFDPPEAREKKDALSSISLFGAEITGKNITFILDISGSMMATDKVKVGSGKVSRRTTVGDPRKDPEYIESRRRITRAKKELVKVVRNLPDDLHFNILPYSSEVKPWKPALMPASKAHKEKAIEFIEGLKPEGVTVTDEALEVAFRDLSIDTIYLITDGAPTHVGGRSNERPRDADRIMSQIHERLTTLNFLRGVRIFTLGFPQAEQDFLKRLSKDHSGTYTPIE